MSSTEPLSTTSSGNSAKSSLRIDMPAPPEAYIQPSPAYVIASTPTPSQNPHDGSWHPTHHHHHIHIATPHPLAAASQFLDKHVPAFSKHHTEYATNRAFRAAKREARHSSIDSPIPEVDVEHLPTIGSAIPPLTAAAAAPALANSDAEDAAAWQDVLRQQEAARRRSGTDKESEPVPDATSNSDSESSPTSKNGAMPPKTL